MLYLVVHDGSIQEKNVSIFGKPQKALDTAWIVNTLPNNEQLISQELMKNYDGNLIVCPLDPYTSYVSFVKMVRNFHCC